MRCSILYSGKNKKKIILLSSAELARRVVKVKVLITIRADDIPILSIYKFISEKIRLNISCELDRRFT